ncbi:MAG: sulfatase-like hydrolase/transferase [candidate division KSB1 bacterium]|nr:sulfatase-like hydrolase/transferase [candidate division KSB1 bacterium]
MSFTCNRRTFLKAGAGAAVLSSAGFSGMISCGAEHKPNILFILVDDMGWSDLGCYGAEIKTPNIDRLAENGLRFTQCYNTAKCFPSRACLLTGVYAQQCGMDEKHGEIKNAVTLGEVLKSAGYRTLASGKHHGTENLYDRGFDHYYRSA